MVRILQIHGLLWWDHIMIYHFKLAIHEKCMVPPFSLFQSNALHKSQIIIDNKNSNIIYHKFQNFKILGCKQFNSINKKAWFQRKILGESPPLTISHELNNCSSLNSSLYLIVSYSITWLIGSESNIGSFLGSWGSFKF